MSIEVSQALSRFFRQEVGQSLRLVAHYTDDEIDFVYLRDDLEETYDEEEFSQTFTVHRQDKATAIQQQSVIAAGNHHVTLRIYDDAIVFNFTQTDEVGTVVSVTPEVGQNLLTFVTRSLKQLHTSSPQEVTVPQWARE